MRKGEIIMKKTVLLLLILLFMLLFYAPISRAVPSSALNTGQSTNITAAGVAAKYVQAIGGIEALKKINTKKVRYRVHMFGRDGYVMERQWKRPDNMRQGSPDGPRYTLTEGMKSWRVTPEGRREMPGPVSANFAKLADIDGPLVDYEKKGIVLEYVGNERYDMTELHHLKMTFKDGVEWDLYFDAGSGFLRKMKQPSFYMVNNEISRGPDSLTYYYDYRSVENINIPHLWIQEVSEDHIHAFVVEEVALNK